MRLIGFFAAFAVLTSSVFASNEDLTPSIRQGEFSASGYLGYAAKLGNKRVSVGSVGKTQKTTSLTVGQYLSSLAGFDVSTLRDGENLIIDGDDYGPVDSEILDEVIGTTTTSPSFKNTYKLPAFKTGLTPSVEFGYGLYDNVELFVKANYLTLKGSTKTYPVIGQASSSVTPKFRTSNASAFGTYVGARYFFQMSKYVKPFAGLNVGMMWGKQNSFSYGAQLGFEIPVSETVSFVAKAETFSGKLQYKIKDLTTATQNASFKNAVKGKKASVTLLPISAGLRVRF